MIIYTGQRLVVGVDNYPRRDEVVGVNEHFVACQGVFIPFLHCVLVERADFPLRERVLLRSSRRFSCSDLLISR